MVTTHGRWIIKKPWMQQEEYRNAANTPLCWTDGIKNEVYQASQLVHGWNEEWVKYLDYISNIDISHDAPYRQRLRHERTMYVRSVDSNKQAGPLCQRPGYKSSADSRVSVQRAQGKGVLHIPMHWRTRQNNTLDLAVLQHLELLSFNWKTYFSSYSPPKWTESPTWWSSSSWDHQWKEWHTQGGQSRTDKYKEICTVRSERKGLNCCQVHPNPDSICSLAHFYFLVFLAVSLQTVATAMNATGEVYREHFTVRTHARFFSLRTPHVITRLAQGLDDSVCPERSFHHWSCLCWPTSTPSPLTGIRLARLCSGLDRLAI